MDYSLVFGLDLPVFLFLFNVEFNFVFDGFLFIANICKLLRANRIFEVARLLLIANVLGDGAIDPVFEVDVQLILETVSPVVFIGQELHALLEVCRKKLLGDVEALKLIHRLDLLLSLSSGVVKSLVLLFDSSDFSLDFGLPVAVLKLPSLVILVLKLSYFFKFVLLLNF